MCLIRVSLKKLVEQRAFEFLFDFIDLLVFDAESSLELRYLVINCYWESRSDTAFRGTVQDRASRGQGCRLRIRTARLLAAAHTLVVCKSALCFELWPKHLVVFDGGIHCCSSLPVMGERKRWQALNGDLFLELGIMYRGEKGISLISALLAIILWATYEMVNYGHILGKANGNGAVYI